MKALVLSGGAAHGAFQAGAIAALESLGWEADIICGSSVGSINGTAYASNKSADDLIKIWLTVTNKSLFRWRPVRDWPSFLKWDHILDTAPLKNFLQRNLDFTSVYESDKILLSVGVDVLDGSLKIFSNKLGTEVKSLRKKYEVRPLDIDSLLASSAIPGIFPWVNGIWDGCLRQSTPLKPAVMMGATEIVIVHMDVAPATNLLPSGIIKTAFRIIEIASGSSLSRDLKLLESRNGLEGYRKIKTHVITPSIPFSYSKLNFDSSDKRDAIKDGYLRTLDVMNKG